MSEEKTLTIKVNLDMVESMRPVMRNGERRFAVQLRNQKSPWQMFEVEESLDEVLQFLRDDFSCMKITQVTAATVASNPDLSKASP